MSPIDSPLPVYKESATSITRGVGLPDAFISAKAAFMVSENSLSTSTIFASLCSSMKATAGGSKRVFNEHSTAPTMGTPKCASTIGGVLGSITATVSKRRMPD